MVWYKQFRNHARRSTQRHAGAPAGYSLVEVLVILFVFTSLFMTMLVVFESSINNLVLSKTKIVAAELGNEQMEILRNLNYDSVGTVNGSPAGTLADSRQVARANVTFTVNTVIKYVDDPFDGCVGTVIGQPSQSRCADGTIVNKPPDTPANNNNPADYKKADVIITWTPNYTGHPVKLTTNIAPKGLEGPTTKGFMLVTVFNAAGDAVSDATVHITNSTLVPAYDKTFTTDAAGTVLLLDLEPAADSYVVVITKAGYSTARTCSVQANGTTCTDAEGNPDPVKKNLSISQGSLEEISFSIDQVSTLALNSYNQSCIAQPNISFTLQGQKTVSNEPSSIPKNSYTFQTDGSGQWSINTLEWDFYDLLVNSAGLDIAGINHDLALNILPNTSTTLNVLLAAHTANSLLLTVKDNTGTSLSGASVRLTGTGYDQTKITGHGFLQQTNWIGGSGQSDFVDATKYLSDDSHIDATTSGQVSLRKNAPTLFFTEQFNTTTYRDDVNTTADWNTLDGQLKLPTAGPDYVSPAHAQTTKLNSQQGKIISATLTANELPNGQTITYQLSADGGVHYENVTLGVLHAFTYVGKDMRVRVDLSSADPAATPIINDFTVNYTIEYFDASGELISSTYNMGSTATFSTLSLQPSPQAPETGADSLRVQIATNNDNATWNFLGPDGTSGTYYTAANTIVNAVHNGNQYLRYKVFLGTSDVYYTPVLNDIKIAYTLGCFPPGQVFFDSLNAETYTADISLTGYESTTIYIDVSGYTSQTTNLNTL